MKQSLRSQPLKLAAIDIPFDLRILGSRFVAGKPITKGRKLTLTESLYSLFNGFYCTHAAILRQKRNRPIFLSNLPVQQVDEKGRGSTCCLPVKYV